MTVKKIINTCLMTAISSPLFAGSQIKPIEPIMSTIPAGSYEMGTLDRQSTQPIHKVTFKEFSMGKYEVTVREFAQFIKATDYPAPTECRHELDGWFKLASKGNWETNSLNTSEFQPVVCINWQTANAYVEWLAEQTGKPYRLPSESEWEYAARAGTKTDYYFGDDKSQTKVCQYANTADLYGENILQRDANTSYYNWSTGLNNCSDHSAYASIVGMYLPNQFGLHDMISNVLEYTADCFVFGYEDAPSDGSPRLDGECEGRSSRGGSWHWNHFPLAYRFSLPEDFAGGVDGFRVAMDGASPTLSIATRGFLANLQHAQEKETKRRLLQHQIPAAVQSLKLNQQGSQVRLTWDQSNGSDVESYRVYRNNLTGNMFKLLAANLKQTDFIDAKADQHQYQYTVVAVRNHLQSNYAEPVTTQAGLIPVPGKIEAEWASSHEGSALSFSSDSERGGNVLTGNEGIEPGAEMIYKTHADQQGGYQFDYRVASMRAGKGFELFVNGEKVADNAVADTGGAHNWLTQKGAVVRLKKGENTLTLKSLDDNWKLNWIALTKI